jgi:hypothetical protein
MGRFRTMVLPVLGVVIVTAGLTVGASSAAAQTPTTKADCKNGGWRQLTDASGTPFRNQGQCVAFANHHEDIVTLADLSGSFTGTTELGSALPTCSFFEQRFDATYASAGAGSATFHADGCVLLVGPTGLAFDGTFTITTSIGSVSGSVDGPIDAAQIPLHYELTLTVESATGAFGGTAGGTLHASFDWDGNSPGTITGTFSVP